MAMPPVNRVNAGQLVAHIDRCWDFRGKLEAHISEALPALKERAHQTNDFAVELLAGKSLLQAGEAEVVG
jgi:hypothetical protein